MGKKPKWTPAESDYLQNNWGIISEKSICSHLGRSENAIRSRAYKLNLGAFLDNGKYITFNQLMIALGRGNAGSYPQTSWVENREMPVKTMRVCNNRFRIIYLADFWKWAEANRTFIDFAKFKKNSLGAEPDWASEQRKIDVFTHTRYKNTPWTPEEDTLLKDLLKLQRYGYFELSNRLGRTSGAIQRRVCDLGIKHRPVRADNTIEWTTAEIKLLGQLIKSGSSYELMSAQLQKSSKAIRGKVYSAYFTESLDKVIKLIGKDNFGDNRPTPTVKQYRRHAETKSDLTALAELLLLRRNQIAPSYPAFDGYWQKDMCTHWDTVNGCIMREDNCDSCIQFQRIKPQYCKRCGGTFYQHFESLLCEQCRMARKKQAQHKWAVLNQRRKTYETYTSR